MKHRHTDTRNDKNSKIIILTDSHYSKHIILQDRIGFQVYMKRINQSTQKFKLLPFIIKNNTITEAVMNNNCYSSKIKKTNFQ